MNIARHSIPWSERSGADKDDKDRRFIFQMNQHLIVIDARTGKSIYTLFNNGMLDLQTPT